MNRIHYTGSLLAVTLAGYGASASAQQADPQQQSDQSMPPSFEQADENGDGRLSRDELTRIEGVEFA